MKTEIIFIGWVVQAVSIQTVISIKVLQKCCAFLFNLEHFTEGQKGRKHFCPAVRGWLGEMVRTEVHQCRHQWRSWYFDPKSMPASYFASKWPLPCSRQAQMSHNWCQIGGYLYDGINYPWQGQRQWRWGRDYALSPSYTPYKPPPPTTSPNISLYRPRPLWITLIHLPGNLTHTHYSLFFLQRNYSLLWLI